MYVSMLLSRWYTLSESIHEAVTVEKSEFYRFLSMTSCMQPGYATVDIDEVFPPNDAVSTVRRDVTGTLGCTHTRVAILNGTEDTIRTPAAADEHLVLPIDAHLRIDTSGTIPDPGLGFIPAGAASEIHFDVPGTAIIISANVPDPNGSSTVLDLDTRSYEIPETSDVAIAWLTDQLGCREMKVNARRLESGQHVPLHTEGTQEELFVPLTGTGSMRLDATRRETPVGTITRVSPETPRSAHNDGSTSALWVMIGAPPTGDSDWWDPGAEILE